MCWWGREGTSSFAQLRLLLWKNWLLRKRRLGATCCELLFPVGAVFILIMIRALVTIDDVDTEIPILDKSSAAGNMPLFLQSMTCGDFGKNRFPFEGIGIAAGPSLAGGANSPEVSGLAKLIREAFELTAVLGNFSVPCCIIPVNATYFEPGCYAPQSVISDYVTNPAGSLIHTFNSSDDMDAYLGQDNYGWHDDIPTLAFGIILDHAPPNLWTYTIRANSSDVPWTGQSLNTLTTGYDRNKFFQYYDNHILTLQWMIQSFVLQFRTAEQPKIKMPATEKKFAFAESPSLFAFDIEKERVSVTSPLFDVSFLSFPVPAHRQDNFKQYIGSVFGLFLVVAFMWPFSRMVRNMVEEKENKLSEGMKMMGLRNSMYWMHWVVTYLMSFTLVCIFVIATSKGNLFKYSDSGLLFLFFFSFCLSLISLACLVTTFFGRAKTAGTLSPFVLLAAYLPYFTVSDTSKAEGVKNLSCLLSPVAFSLGSTNIISYEGVFIGSQWDNTNQLVDNFRLSTSITLMFFDAFLYGALAWYLDKIWPREYGKVYRWYFLFTPSYWKSCFCCCSSKKRARHNSQDDALFAAGPDSPPRQALRGISVTTASPARPAFSSASAVPNYGTPGYATPLLSSAHDDSGMMDEVEPDFGSHYEAVPEELRSKVGIKVRGLRKKYPARDGIEVVAVEGLDLNLYQGQCFVLLGHNGAGKTTTISMLTGMLETSSGTATMYGRDVNTEMDEIRTFMGSCPQHDVLFPDLTVYEHLYFFGKLKGIALNDLHSNVMTAIDEVQLRLKIETKASELSGGQRRRLSLAIALIGDSKVVFLDEPTSGVDPFSRRAIWDLLTKKKQGRILVLTTHFMDEADQLGDRIGIMHHGRMKCCGTSLFLKSQFGVGYNMTLLKDAHCNVDGVTSLVQRNVPSASVLSSVGSELSYSLPFSASSVFPQLLGDIDANLDKLGLINYGLSVTTMEEVFLKVASEERSAEPKEDAQEVYEQKKPAASSNGSGPKMSDQEALGTAGQQGASWWTHFTALLTKRYHIQKRDKKALCCQFLVPLILLAMGMGLLRIPPNYDFDSITLLGGDLSPYNLPNRLPYNEGLDPAVWSLIYPDEGTVEKFEQGWSGTGTYDLFNFSVALLDNRTQYKESRYGAFFGSSFNATFWAFDVLNNASAVHGLPTWSAVGHQSLLRTLTGDKTASIIAHIHPFSWTAREKQAVQSINGIFASIVISLAFTFIPASFAVFIVSEREFKTKHLQMISGVGITSYWAANFVWDFFSFLIPASISCMIIYAYQNPELIQNFDALLFVFASYGFSVIPFTYLLSFLFTSHSTAQNVMIMIYILGGIILTNTTVALYYVPSTTTISKMYLRHVFRLVPSFCLGDAIFYISILPWIQGEPGKWDLIVTGFDIIYMVSSAIVYFILTLLLDYLSSIPSFVGLFKKDPEMTLTRAEMEEPEDEDIKAERERLQGTALTNGEHKFRNLTDSIELQGAERAMQLLTENHAANDARSDLIRIEGLRKVFPKKTAVKDVYFGVPAGQCFGFLGVNGAGKTTTLKIMTGDVTPSSGKAFIAGYDIASYPTEVRRLMGYTPQHDALFDFLSAREVLNFYGTIRGIPADRMKPMVDFLLDRLSLTEYADRPCGTYSGGNKRKLSVGIALIGNPPVVFLDEPSTGMDPVSRRFMWDFISETMTHRAVILTTHSMEECEALCTRIAILVNGALKCIGSSQHLKSRFGRGFQLDISTASNDATAARDFIFQYFPDAEKLEDYGGKMKYKILSGRSPAHVAERERWKLKDLFALVEKFKKDVGISEYSISQGTLEQIFIAFARKGDVEEFGGRVQSEEEVEEEMKLQTVQTPNQRIHRVGSFETEDPSNRIVTPSSYGYVPADSSGINY